MRNRKTLFPIIIFFLISIGLFYHLASLFSDYRLRYTITEDGYYMLTIARNIALGLGMSTAEGQIPTNGGQPFYTLVFAAVSWLVNSDKILILKLTVIIQLLISISGFVLIWKMGEKLFEEKNDSSRVSLLAAAIWFSSPLSLLQTTNGLETGFYTFSILLFVWLLVFKTKKLNFTSSVLSGLFLGVIFLVRNDGIFFIAVICVFIIFYKFYDKEKLSNNFIHVIIIGLVSVIIALPWLIYNLKFGSIIPISGRAQLSGESDFIFIYAVVVFMEYFFLFYAIPLLIKDKAIVIVMSFIISVVIFALLFKNYKQFTNKQKQVFFIAIFLLLSLGIFYGMYFKSYYFLERYLFPASPFICLLWSLVAFKIFEKIRFSALRYAIAGLFFTYFAAISVKNYQNDYQLYFSINVNWIEKNVKESEWIGSLNSGALGYYHDKTINLDGKVNPDALKAIEQNKLWEYALDMNIDYLVHDIVTKDKEIIQKHYDLVFEYVPKNIGIYRRKGIRYY